MLQVGDTAPEFTLPDQSEAAQALRALRKKIVVLYFYPKDMTSGCTTQACGLRDCYAAITRAGAVVVGISKDAAKRHQAFRAKHDLPFALLVDADCAVAKAYGVWQQKMLYGRSYMGTERTTFIIDTRGKIAAILRKFKAAEHADLVVDTLRQLSANSTK